MSVSSTSLLCIERLVVDGSVDRCPTSLRPAERVRDVQRGFAVAVRDHSGERHRRRVRRCSATPLCTEQCRVSRPSTCACRRRSTGRSTSARTGPTSGTCSCRTFCRPRGKPCSTPRSPMAAPWWCSGSARSASCHPDRPAPRLPGDRHRPGPGAPGDGRQVRHRSR